MKKLKLFIAFIFLTYGLSAQVESIGLSGLDESWIYQPLDTGVVDTSSNVYNFIYADYIDHAVINNENHIFLLNHMTTSFHGTGGFLQKIDYRTGELLWATPFDLRNDSSQSQPFYYRIIGDEIQVVGFRSKIPYPIPWSEGKPEVRYYSMEDGTLNNLVYSNSTPPNLKPTIYRDVIMPTDNGYCFLNVLPTHSDSFNINFWEDYIIYFDNATNAYDTIKQVHFGQDSSKYSANHSELFIDNNKISSIIYFKDLDNQRYDYEIILRTYNLDNREFELFNLTDLIHEPNHRYKIISIKDNDSVTLISTKYYPYDKSLNDKLQFCKIMKFNLNDNTSKIVNLNYDNDSSFLYSNAFELSNDRILVINTYKKPLYNENEEHKESYKMLLLDKNLNYEIIKEFEADNPNWHYVFRDCMLLPDDILLLKGGRCFGYNTLYSFYIGIDSKKLGMVKNEEIDNNLSIDIFPNPTSGDIVISGISSKAEVEILDELGKCLYKGVLNSPSERLDVSKYKNGVYFVRVKSKNGILNTKKVVKM